LVNPNPKKALAADGSAGAERNLVGKVVCLGKSYYRMAVSPSGVKLQLTPMQLSWATWPVRDPATAPLLSSRDYGVSTIAGVKDQKIALAEGKWKLVSYTLDATAQSAAASRRDAAFQNNLPAVPCGKERSPNFRSGAPSRAVVTAARTKPDEVSLRLEFAGPSGERCRACSGAFSAQPKERRTST